jgi:ketosteroid isomerase-like protein
VGVPFEHDHGDETVMQREYLDGANARMKIGIPIIFWSIFCLTTAVAAAQARDNPVADEIRKLEHSKFDAIQQKDNVTLDAMFDDGLLWVDENGMLWTKAAGLAYVHSSTEQILDLSPQAMSLEIVGDVAIVVGVYEERGLKAGHAYVRRYRFIDTWAFRKGKWICIATTATSAVSQGSPF